MDSASWAAESLPGAVTTPKRRARILWTAQEVDAIRTPRSGGDSAMSIAKRFGVPRVTVWEKTRARPLDPQASRRLSRDQFPRDSGRRIMQSTSRHAWIAWLWSPSGPLASAHQLDDVHLVAVARTKAASTLNVGLKEELPVEGWP